MIQFFSKLKNSKKGFTLVELMVVVVIIGILVAIAVPIYNTTTTNAQNRADQANIRVIEGALQSYIANTGGTYADITLSASGAVGGTGITAGNLIPNYLKEMPKRPTDSTKSYTKAANGNVVGQS